jgi:hypothetical protein
MSGSGADREHLSAAAAQMRQIPLIPTVDRAQMLSARASHEHEPGNPDAAVHPPG